MIHSDDDSQLSSSNRFGVVNGKGASKTKPTQKKIDKSKLRIKMVVDIAKLDTGLKDNIEKEFVDVADNTDLFTEKHGYFGVKCAVPGLFRWTFMSTNDLIQCKSVPVEVIDNFALVLFPCDEFLKLLMKSADGIEFDDLEIYVSNIKTTMTTAQLCPAKSSLIVVLMDLDKHMLKLQRKLSSDSSNTRPTLNTLLDSAVAYLIYELDVEVVRWKRASELVEYLSTLCKVLSERDPHETVTEIDFVHRVKKRQAEPSMSAKQQADHELRETWAAMLQMIPQLSKAKAQSLVGTPGFSCLRGTVAQLDDPSVAVGERMTLLQTSFGHGKSKVVRNEAKLSKQVFRAFTATDGAAAIDRSA